MAYRALEDIMVEEIGAAGVPPDEAERLHAGLRRILLESGSSGPEAWDAISKRLLSPDFPFPLHQMMYYGCYCVASTNIGRLLQRRGKELLGSRYKDPISSFTDFQEFSVDNPEVLLKGTAGVHCVLYYLSGLFMFVLN
ncbi:hypothetical protein B296_00037311 [Ensete ventricosum]|uniref:Uncharacterized protein n=1 Tax=Ensete ventricosum TaxID=4639 RepID=A0A426Y743_ENSVE|nr:hypothetical protein B296_00037311 [Ensete ventricosum]